MPKKIIRRPAIHFDLSLSHLPTVLQRVYSSRGITSFTELEHDLPRLLPFQHMMGIDQAVTYLTEALVKQENILIVGDFDADGATSTVVALRALRSFGAKHVDFLVPNRFAFGYGITPELVEVAKKFKPGLIVTVDNGISNHAGVLAAVNEGIKVIITDHHLPGDALPLAHAIVNPNQLNDAFASKNIAGVGVIFYVMLALRRRLLESNWFQLNNLPEPNMSKLLDLVALGTVADVVSLDHNNRILVHQGLRRIRAGQCVPGITALLEIANRHPARLVAADLGFSVAPRLNAAGRLEDMSLGIECLLTDDLQSARDMAQKLDQLNNERREIEQDMQDQAFHILKKLQLDSGRLADGICLFDEEWHQGVIGILASRVKDKVHRPVIAFALANEHELKGSARSIAGLHIRDVLAHIATHHPTLIGKFGGHAMAAGLTIPRASFENFSHVFADVVAARVNEEILDNILLSDGELQNEELTLEVAELLREAGPWGQAFPEPTFDGKFEILDQRLVGGKHLKMILGKAERTWDAIAFNIDVNYWPNYRCAYVDVAYRMDVNEYRGKRSVQLIVEHLEVAKESSLPQELLPKDSNLAGAIPEFSSL